MFSHRVHELTFDLHKAAPHLLGGGSWNFSDPIKGVASSLQSLLPQVKRDPVSPVRIQSKHVDKQKPSAISLGGGGAAAEHDGKGNFDL